MNWSRKSSWHRLLCLCLLAAALLSVAGAAPAQQESFDQRRDRAIDLFNNAKMEDACDSLQQLDKEKPGDKQTQAYLKMSCAQVKVLQKTEEDLFNQGVGLFNQGQFDDARQKFDQTAKVHIKNPRYRDKALDYIKQVDARQNEEHVFQEAVKLYNDRKYTEAQTRFNPLAQGGGPRAGEARNYLTKIGDALKQHPVDHTFEEAVRLYNTGDYDSAKSDFKKVVKAGGPKAAEAQDYLGKIEARIKPPEPPPTTPNEPPPSGPTAASDESLRAGLRAYFTGDLVAAERDLSDYLKQNGSKQSLAYFFRGATHSTRYFLSGEKDSQEMTLAITDFQSAKTRDRAFHPPSKYIPPKIMALYSVAESAPSQ